VSTAREAREMDVSEMFAVLIRRAVFCAGATVALALPLYAQGTDPRYQTRESDCRHQPPTAKSLEIRRSDTGIRTHGYTAERVITLAADARQLTGGDILVCTEYGRVEIADSDDGEVRLQIRMEGFGEGSTDPRAAAVRVIEETPLHMFIADSAGRLLVRVWHSRLGFTTPGGQPAWVNVRLMVPLRGAYAIRTEAFHGNVAIRRLTLSSATLRGNVGEKFKGISGFIGETDLDNVSLAGEVDIDNLAGIPGVRAPVPTPIANLAAPILIKARVTSSSRIRALTGGNISIAVQPSSELGIRAIGQANVGRVNIGIDGGVADSVPVDSTFRVQRAMRSPALERSVVRVEVRASSTHGTVHIASIPSAPLMRR
jgi:hypothetical protein